MADNYLAMGFRYVELQLPTNFSADELRAQIAKRFAINEFTFQIESQSLDARNRANIHWLVRAGVSSEALATIDAAPIAADLAISNKNRSTRVLVAGTGPAGFFAAWVLQRAGFRVTLIDRGTEVNTRGAQIAEFERTGTFSPVGNYAFGEGGAGTFSDGKLTSRSKHISAERQFILKTYLAAGAPPEIAYLAHPHLGSDNLRTIVRNLRQMFVDAGGTVRFETQLTDVAITNGKVTGAWLGTEAFEAEYLVVAPGHSAFDTYRMLMRRGVPFRTKNFAIGSRAEHRQEIINIAQWGCPSLAGVKAAEYRLTAETSQKQPVYTFCMCPGGVVVPAMATADTNIVNGMSLYLRDGRFANAACVAGLHPDQLTGKTSTPEEALDALEGLERRFYSLTGGYRAAACTIRDFTAKKLSHTPTADTSYPLGIVTMPLWEHLPPLVANGMREGLASFCRKIKGYDSGLLIGLESKTSSPVQVIRSREGLVEGFSNLYIAGEGSGYAGGIISSAADGIKAAMDIIGRCN